MKKNIFLLWLCLFCCSSLTFSQESTSYAEKMAANGITVNTDNGERCGTAERHEQMMQYPVFAKAYNEAQEQISLELLNKNLPPCANPLIVPVVVHFQPTNISNQCMIDATIAQIDQMNLDFAGCNANAGLFCDWIAGGCDTYGGTAGGDSQAIDGSCIQFCLADQNLPADANLIPGGLAITTSYSVDNQNAPALWNGYLNIYVGPIGGGSILGFVNFLGGASNTNTSQGASVLTSAFGSQNFTPCEGVGGGAPFDGGATLTHEVGHWFGLEHTWDDNFADTPAQGGPNFGCTAVNANTCGCTGDCDGYGGNFMDYVDDDCMFRFTEDQIMLMQATGAPQADWATNSISCMITYPDCSQQGACVLACPAVVTTPYSGTEEICAISTPSYDLPTDFSSVVLDDDSDAVFTWSTGGYISAGGTPIAGPYAVTPAGCEPLVETFYLNVDCGTTPLATPLDAGTLELTAFPDPTTFIVGDLVTFTDGACDGPTFVVTPGCETYVTVAAAAGSPTFPVAAGEAGTVNYDVTLNYPIECCCPVTMAIQTEANTTPAAIPDNGGPGNPGCSTVTIPNGGTITDVVIDVDVTHTWVGDLIITVTSPAGTSAELGAPAGCPGDDLMVTFDDAATSTAADFAGTCNNLPAISGAFQPTNPLSVFDGEDAAGDWVLCISDNAGADTGDITNFGVTVTTEEPCTDNANCVLMGMANYNCMAMGMPYCDDICFTEYNAAPGPDDTPDATLCVTPVDCGGDASCLVVAPCDDGDPCTINDEETTAPDGSICVPCAGTVDPTSCDAACATVQACDDGDPCTINDEETVAADGSICVPCAGIVDPTSCDAGCTTTQACDDGDPCTTGETETLAADGSICVPCGNGTAVMPACGDPTASNYEPNATCIDNTICTYGSYCDNICFAEYATNPGPNDTPDATLCVTPLGCADSPDASCLTTVACDDGDPCTENEMETTVTATGEACGDCGLNATPVTPACGDPTATNYDATATCIDNTLCTYAPCEDAIAGTVTLVGCDFTGTTVNIYDSNGTLVATAMTDAMGNYSLAGPFPCGSYTAELMTAPACYIDEGGDVGPRQFNINGDGIADGFNFAPIPNNIPTVGEWGLIILGLMMSIVAIIGIRERKASEMYS